MAIRSVLYRKHDHMHIAIKTSNPESLLHFFYDNSLGLETFQHVWIELMLSECHQKFSLVQ